jgi:hypothetical protein
MACGEKLAYGYRRVAWWLQRKRTARESQARVTSAARTWVAGTLASAAHTKEERVGPRGTQWAKSDLAVGHDQDLGTSCNGWAYLVDVNDCCTREIVRWNVNLNERTITIRRSVFEREESTSKSGAGDEDRTRTVPIDASVAMELRNHLQGRWSGYLFETRNATPLRLSMCLRTSFNRFYRG